ncbi:Multidrug export protein MepA [Candidatus Izimaplasma bacterium HR1]|jgi:putative MATE family efflux protein|uniref:MATE family efflux transporter n=1 Tax=Candidatus Izimoplasma sp. HR1 TaxID=1541959 RepID=UPI0004F77119|nr:Multidrug export protein MepA [Candidatus Izimaplasma bacterium HR1]
MNENSDLLGNTNIRKLLIKLSIPAIVGMGVNALYNLVDTIFVAQGAGEIAIGALAYAFPVQMILYAVGLMIGIGGASVFSRAYGRGDTETMKHTINTSLRVGIVLALLVSLFGYLFLDEMLVFFRASDSNIGFAKDYLSVILIGLVPLTLSMVLNNFARAEGRANLAMFGFIMGAGLNIILDPIFIYDWGLGLGVKGAAIATVISQFSSFTFLFFNSLSKKSILEINLINPFLINLKVLKDVVVIGLPTFVRNSLGSILSIIIFILIDESVSGDPAIYISIYGVMNRLINFLFLPSFGVVQGLAPIVGFNYGAKKFKRIRETINDATLFVFVYFTIALILIQVFAPQMFMIFSKDHSEFFISTGARGFRILSLGFMFVSFQVVMGSVYQAMGYPIKALLVSLSRQFLFFLPLVFIFTNLYGLDGLWITFAVADVLAGILSIILFVSNQRYLNRMIEPELLTT